MYDATSVSIAAASCSGVEGIFMASKSHAAGNPFNSPSERLLYRLVFRHGNSTMDFYGTYREVTPPSRLVWTNEEDEGGEQVTTVTFEEKGGKTLLVVHDLYPSKEALDAAIASGSTGGFSEQFEQLDELLVTLDASVGS